ncbi:serine hydrolase domain-containing protein [Paraburkholderia bryophila]|uniref:CubicO group peptidase (Beta-lactamase class C family) n=1 Tax=Paraburkholderia bryophila TaxID=420952 RepID=A0A7Y9W7G2_9BURK|nr:serine hydrolase [Paraburkholderia bryophila]NYH15612.1 CubicO group peptidase (beta-lactamase class C family) [Paraburkholderia bryophila]
MLGACASEQPSATVSASAPSPDASNPQSTFPSADWTQAPPATQGFSQEGIDRAVSYAKQQGSTSGMIVHSGVVVAEWGDVSRRSNLYSARKSFISALIGIAVGRGQMHLDDTLAQLGVDDNEPALSPTEKQATVRMLLEARSGVYHPSVYETAEMQATKPPRYSHPPGTFWYYNNWDFNTVGAIYAKATGRDIFQALQTEIANPIGMQDYRPSDGHYVSGGLATRYPAYLIDMSARDLARFALLYLHDGRWRDRQIVPAEWVAESTQSYSDTTTGGYGYMWWTSVPASRPRGPKAALLRPTFWGRWSLGSICRRRAVARSGGGEPDRCAAHVEAHGATENGEAGVVGRVRAKRERDRT